MFCWALLLNPPSKVMSAPGFWKMPLLSEKFKVSFWKLHNTPRSVTTGLYRLERMMAPGCICWILESLKNAVLQVFRFWKRKLGHSNLFLTICWPYYPIGRVPHWLQYPTLNSVAEHMHLGHCCLSYPLHHKHTHTHTYVLQEIVPLLQDASLPKGRVFDGAGMHDCLPTSISDIAPGPQVVSLTRDSV